MLPAREAALKEVQYLWTKSLCQRERESYREVLEIFKAPQNYPFDTCAEHTGEITSESDLAGLGKAKYFEKLVGIFELLNPDCSAV